MDERFERPIMVIANLGLPTQIEDARQALIWLDDRPLADRDSAHRLAMKACRAALIGDIEAETACSIVLAFARKHNLTAPDVDLPTATQPNQWERCSP